MVAQSISQEASANVLAIYCARDPGSGNLRFHEKVVEVLQLIVEYIS
jgi:hypothetical protein